jgi:CCAAT-binding transcription factor (CBF-B/NF-YA) subunit B
MLDEMVFASALQDLDEEPLFVNAKQYHRILKRRMARARLAEIQKLSTQRKVRLYSRNPS